MSFLGDIGSFLKQAVGTGEHVLGINVGQQPAPTMQPNQFVQALQSGFRSPMQGGVYATPTASTGGKPIAINRQAANNNPWGSLGPPPQVSPDVYKNLPVPGSTVNFNIQPDLHGAQPPDMVNVSWSDHQVPYSESLNGPPQNNNNQFNLGNNQQNGIPLK